MSSHKEYRNAEEKKASIEEVTRIFRHEMCAKPNIPPHIIWNAKMHRVKMHFGYWSRVVKMERLDAYMTMVIQGMKLLERPKRKRHAEEMLKDAAVEFQALWRELLDMSGYGYDRNPYIDKHWKHSYAQRCRRHPEGG